MVFTVETVDLKSNEEDESFIVTRKQRFSYSEIRRMTNNFQRVLGQDGFEKVYHGYLNGNDVAVKMLSSSPVQGHRQFLVELKLLFRVHYKSLTTLVGYCNEGFGNVLVYEYMAMGNLRSYLSGSSRRNILSLEDRLRIAIDIALG
ncbi:Tyrosine-protein kinase [Parasponia andersonii]|uniref:Tyrosine-protein kinase n=1 Tax=Parasponia andersonii TaxID=3476 RepID=A0A2P5ASY4_PARAD|nr:Tyrosine-protein kinase [Parasponia andersonii]